MSERRARGPASGERRALLPASVAGLVLAGALGGCAAAPPPAPVLPPEPVAAAPEPETAPAPAPDTVSVLPAEEAPTPAPLAVALPAPVPTEAARLVARAERLAREGQPEAARETYQLVVKSYQDDPAHARALYELGRLLVDPASAARDYRAAYAAFDQLTAQHPESRWTAEARAWRAALAELLARDGEAARLRGDLRRLKRMDLELEKRR